MSAYRNNQEISNPRTVRQLMHGMRQFWRAQSAFSKDVAAFRLYMHLKNSLGSRHVPPPDYIPARLTNSVGPLQQRMRDLQQARALGRHRHADRIEQEFANIDVFERTYGSVIDEFKNMYEEPAAVQTRSTARNTQETSGDSGAGGNCKIGGGGVCQEYDEQGRYTGPGKGSSASSQSMPSPTPEPKNDTRTTSPIDPVTGKHTTPLDDEDRQRVVDEARKMDGTPYGAVGPHSRQGVVADCSGSTVLIFNASDLPLDYHQAQHIGDDPHMVKIQTTDQLNVSKLQKADVIQMFNPQTRSWHLVVYDPDADSEKGLNIRHASPKKGYGPTKLEKIRKHFKITGIYRYHK
ncbi:MAG: hypothetical protein H7835_19790 [Magnetococcus sp. XQGC-1]